jgi:hypothetical protein
MVPTQVDALESKGVSRIATGKFPSPSPLGLASFQARTSPFSALAVALSWPRGIESWWAQARLGRTSLEGMGQVQSLYLGQLQDKTQNCGRLVDVSPREIPKIGESIEGRMLPTFAAGTSMPQC